MVFLVLVCVHLAVFRYMDKWSIECSSQFGLGYGRRANIFYWDYDVVPL